MNLLIKSATVTDSASSFNNKVADILIKDGIIQQIAADIDGEDIEIFDAKGCHIAPGLFDLNCNIGELGLETKEDLETGTAAAAAGGFT
ncbi:MAG: dihydroorotase, partial [Mucilaginibacter sp.]